MALRRGGKRGIGRIDFAAPGAETGRRRGWRRLGRLSHVPPYVRFDAFERGRNAKQVQRWLGHHLAAYTLSTYVHLLDSGVGEPLSLDSELAQSANAVLTGATENDRPHRKAYSQNRD